MLWLLWTNLSPFIDGEMKMFAAGNVWFEYLTLVAEGDGLVWTKALLYDALRFRSVANKDVHKQVVHYFLAFTG